MYLCSLDFPKDYKKHEKRRDEENRMKEELSKYKAEIIKSQEPSKLGICDIHNGIMKFGLNKQCKE